MLRQQFRLLALLASSLALLLASCAGQPQQPAWTSADEEAARQPGKDWVANIVKGDAAAAAATYAEDAMLLPPGESQPVRGRQAIQQFWQGMLDQGLKEAALLPIQVSGSGEMAYEAGTFVLGIQPAGSEIMERVSGKYSVIMKRQPEGGYRVVVDIWNLDAPPAS